MEVSLLGSCITYVDIIAVAMYVMFLQPLKRGDLPCTSGRPSEGEMQRTITIVQPVEDMNLPIHSSLQTCVSVLKAVANLPRPLKYGNVPMPGGQSDQQLPCQVPLMPSQRAPIVARPKHERDRADVTLQAGLGFAGRQKLSPARADHPRREREPSRKEGEGVAHLVVVQVVDHCGSGSWFRKNAGILMEQMEM
tara:strand:- start:178 stop:759 length:582 start_codon:yes stop_codon:yes gene_type:complete